MDRFASDIMSLAPKLDLGRRAFAVTTLAAGFAAAVSPVAAATITTDTTGLEAGEIMIMAEDGGIPAYRAMPLGEGPFPTILVVQEIFGVHEHIKDVCRRFAKLGYCAIAMELFARQGNVATMTDINEIIATVVSKVPDRQVMADLDAAVRYAEGIGKADTGRLGITGFCWGGRITWLYAAHNPKVKAGVAWYGRLVGQATDTTPTQPVDIAAALTVPVLGLYGGQDQGIPLDTVEQMRAALAKGSSGSKIVVFDEAGHAFNADYRPSYVESAAKEGWRQATEWFEAHGVA